MIEIEIDVNKAVGEVITIPVFGFISEIVELRKADPDPIDISVTIDNIFFFFFYFKDLYFLL